MTAPFAFQVRELDLRGFTAIRIAQLLNVEVSEVHRVLQIVPTVLPRSLQAPEPSSVAGQEEQVSPEEHVRQRLADARRDYLSREEARRARAELPGYRGSVSPRDLEQVQW